jgi:hypothetical protein
MAESSTASAPQASAHSAAVIPPDVYEIAYSKTSFKKDAAFILMVSEEISRGGFPHLQGLIQDTDIRKASINLKLVDRARRNELREQHRCTIKTHPLPRSLHFSGLCGPSLFVLFEHKKKVYR